MAGEMVDLSPKLVTQIPFYALHQFPQVVTKDRETGNGFYLIRRFFQSGDGEAVALQLSYRDQLKKGGGAVRKNRDKEAMGERSKANSVQRARSTCRRKILSLQPDRMLTLTFRENVTDLKTAWSCFKKFNRKMKWRFKERWRYVCVPERQERGAWHFHLAVCGYYHIETVRRFWLDSVAELGGNVDITSPRNHGKKSWNPRRVAGYLSKYLTKECEQVGFNEKRFSSGGDIPEPIVTRGWCALGVSIISVLVDCLSPLRRSINIVYEGGSRLPLSYVST